MSWNWGFFPKPGAAAATRSVSPSMAGKELIPAGAFVVQSVLPVVGVERVDGAGVRAREDDVVGDRRGAEVHRRQRSLPKHLAGGRVHRGESAPAGLEANARA